MSNPDYRMYPHVYNLLAQKGQHMPPYFDLLIDPYDTEASVEKSEAELAQIKVPTYTGSGWYGYTYKTHLNGAQSYFANITAPKKLMFTGPRTSSGRFIRSTTRSCAGTTIGSKASTPASCASRA